MIRRLHPVIIIAAMASLALINASCAGTISPTEALAESGREFAEVFSFQNRIKSTSAGGGFTLSLEGTAAYAEDELKYMSMSMKVEGGGTTSNVETLLLPPDYYMKTPDGQWYVLSPWHQGTRPEEVPDMSFDEEFLDYEQIVGDLEGVEQLADETIDGRTYMRFSADMAFSDMDAESEIFGDANGVFHVDLWVDSETKLPERMSVSSEMSVAGSEVTTEMTIWFVYNETIFVPMAPKDTRPWRDLQYQDAPCTVTRFEGCLAAQTDLESMAKPSCEGSGRRVCLVPLGQIDAALVQQLVEYYRAQYGLDIAVLTPLAVPAEAFDDKRQQVDAASLMDYFWAHFRADYDDPDVVLIGITPLDMYDSTSHFRYLFGLKATFEDPKGVISTFRMNPESYNEPSDPGLTLTRFRKLLTKYIGMLYYGLPQNSEPTSPMFGSILRPSDLDLMREPLIIPETQ